MAAVDYLTPTKFLQYQEAFYKEVIRSPLTCDLIVQVVTATDPLSTFVGDSTRTETLYKVPILWERSLDSINRSKYGIEQGRDSTLYIAPKILEKKLGHFNIIAETTRVVFMDKEWLVDKVQKLSPLFNSCIALEVHLQSATKRGQ